MKGRQARGRKAARHRCALAALGCLTVLGAARPALVHAQQRPEEPAPSLVLDDATRAAVRTLADAGVAAYRAQKYDEASEKLEKAFGLMPVPSLALWSARALVARGVWTRAAERYRSARRLDLGPGDPQIQLQAQRSAAEERAALVPRIPSLRVLVQGALGSEVRVSIDGAALPPLLVGEEWPVNPGSHLVVGVRGDERVEAASSLKEGEHAELVLRFAALVEPAEPVALAPSKAPAPALAHAEPAAPPVAARPAMAAASPPLPVARDAGASPWASIGWVSVGVGGAALLTSGALGLAAKGRRDELTRGSDCAGGACLEERRGDVESYNRLVDLSTAGWITGAALMGAGALLVLVVPGSEGVSRVALTPGSVRLSGRF